jgi:hypothetical protein
MTELVHTKRRQSGLLLLALYMRTVWTLRSDFVLLINYYYRLFFTTGRYHDNHPQMLKEQWNLCSISEATLSVNVHIGYGSRMDIQEKKDCL